VSLEPQAPHTDAAAEVREAARRAAGSARGAGAVITGIALTVFLMLAFIVLDYTFDQDPHRIFKVALGLLALGWIMVNPKIGLLVLPVAAPFLPWVPPAPIPGLNALNVLLFAIFGTFALSRVLARQPLFRANHLGVPIGALLLVCAISIVRGAAFPTGYSYNGPLSALVLFRSATTFATYFIVLAMVKGAAERRRVAWAVVIGLLLESLVTMHLGRNGSGGRATGSIGQANELGSFLAMFAVIAFALVPGVKSWVGRIVMLGTFVAASVGLIYSLSRGAMLAFVASLFPVAWRTSRVLFALLLAAAALSPWWAPDYLKDRILKSESEVEGSDEVALDMAAQARLQTWQSLMEVVKTHPIDGIGFTGLGDVLPDIGEGLGLSEVKDSAHNTYLRMIAEMGILGIAAFLWLMTRCLVLSERAFRAARTRFDRGIAVGLMGATISMLVACAFGDRFFNVVIAGSFWVVSALAEDIVDEARRPA
jgi:O-antigen ligase